MCGRFTLTDPTRLDTEAVRAALLGAALPPLVPRYNIAPTQLVPLLRHGPDGREVIMATWGLIPAWAKDRSIGNKMANARGETLAEKPSFRSAWKKRRGVVLADGWYEWQVLADVKAKQPWWIHREDGAALAFGALWEVWSPPEGPPVVSTTLVTTTPNDRLAAIHDRMPVILDWGAVDRWLSAPEPPADLVGPAPSEPWNPVRVSSAVNRPSYDRPDCVMSVTNP